MLFYIESEKPALLLLIDIIYLNKVPNWIKKYFSLDEFKDDKNITLLQSNKKLFKNVLFSPIQIKKNNKPQKRYAL